MNDIKSKILAIKLFEFQASTNKNIEGWEGKANGNVIVSLLDNDTIIFEEKGFFYNFDGKKIKCSNTYRWIFNSQKNQISLEHLRFGIENPVFLFNLALVANNKWESVCPHLCDKDEYNAQMFLFDDKINLLWNIQNEEKYNKIAYCYTFE